MKKMTPRILLAVLAVSALTDCGHHDAAPGGQAPGTGGKVATNLRAASAPREASDPCSLLERSEVEAIMGPLAGPPYRTRSGMEAIEPVAGGDTCVYETPEFRAILLAVEWKDGAMAFNMTNLPGRISSGVTANAPESTAKAAKSLLPGGVQIDGEWDEASSLGCCQIFALRGDQLVTFDYRAWRADTARAVSLLNKALLRLEHPLSIDGNAGNDAAKRHGQTRPKPRSVCGLLSRAEVEAILGPLGGDPQPSPKDDTQECTYRFTQAAAEGSPLSDAPEQFKSLVGALTGGRTAMVAGPVDTAIQIRWRTGFRALSDSEQVGGAVMTNVSDYKAGMPKRTVGRVAEGPWDEAAQTGLTFTAVKQDVAVTIDTVPMLAPEQVELRRRLVAKAIEKISVRD